MASPNSVRVLVGFSDTTIFLSSPCDFPVNGGFVKIENEAIQYSFAADLALVGCIRAVGGTSVSKHSPGAIVNFVDSPVTTTVVGSVEQSETYAGPRSHQGISVDETVDVAVGSNDGSNPKYIAAVMFNLFGDLLSKAANYLAGIIGAYSITGTKSSTYPTGAVLAQITDGVTDVDGAVVAYVDGDGDVTKANAAFKAMSNNSTGGSGFTYGVDLFGAAHDGYNELAILNADLRLSKEVCVFSKAGVPSSDGTGFANTGSLCIDRTNGDVYINVGDKTTPSWKKITHA